MKKTISILIIAIILLSGCISKTNDKSVDNTNSNKDEYSDDGATEETDSDNVQVNYRDLDLNDTNLKVPLKNSR